MNDVHYLLIVVALYIATYLQATGVSLLVPQSGREK